MYRLYRLVHARRFGVVLKQDHFWEFVLGNIFMNFINLVESNVIIFSYQLLF